MILVRQFLLWILVAHYVILGHFMCDFESCSLSDFSHVSYVLGFCFWRTPKFRLFFFSIFPFLGLGGPSHWILSFIIIMKKHLSLGWSYFITLYQTQFNYEYIMQFSCFICLAFVMSLSFLQSMLLFTCKFLVWTNVDLLC